MVCTNMYGEFSHTEHVRLMRPKISQPFLMGEGIASLISEGLGLTHASQFGIFFDALRKTNRMREESNPYGCVANTQGWTICTGASVATAPLLRCAMGKMAIKKSPRHRRSGDEGGVHALSVGVSQSLSCGLS